MKKVITVRVYNPRHNVRLLEISETIKPDLFWFDKREKITPESIE